MKAGKAVQRRERILAYLEQTPVGATAELCEILQVSAMTIHRDFQVMAEQGLITLVRGGAVRNHGTAALYGLQVRQMRIPLEKRRIAKACAGLVQEEMTVYLDCGSTAELIARELRARKGITVLTASLDGAQMLSGPDGPCLIMVPGVYHAAMRGFSGQMTTDFMERFQVDIAFFGANALDVDCGLTSPDYTDAETKRRLIRQVRKVVVAADHTKLGCQCFERIAKLSELDVLVTDRDAAPELIKAMQKELPQVICC
uniref:DeoR/GlpR family DNA-binding transcription regulator n=1 Tax=Mitsuokella multacida TaxID=52226 RepID=UPI0040268452